MKKQNNKKNSRYKGKKQQRSIDASALCITILILILLCVNLVIIMKKVLLPKSEQETEQQAQQQQEKAKQNSTTENTTSADYQLSLLKQGTERDRIEYYCGQFFKYIENKNYTKAYELLYPEFKQQYFPTIEDFTKYVQKTYPSILVINYDDIDRQGDIYVTTLIIDDALSTDRTKQFTQRIVVQESDYNKYVLSFQVI